MDFLLKKFVSLFLMPLPIGVGLLILALFFLYRHKVAKAKITLVLSILWIFLISYSPLVDTLLNTLESQNKTLQTAPKDVQYIYVLGGGHHSDSSRPITSQIIEVSLVRLNEGIRLYRQLEGKAKIIFSGYTGLFDPNEHAKMQEKLALSLGVKKEDIHLYLGTRDTQEEAQAGKALLKDKKFILVTSASHMSRALKFFNAEGLYPIPAPTNHLSHTQHLDYTDIFSATALRKSHILWHEYLGQLWQRLKG
jgi:uncharacterized SAM-binding protein YcdF (DUF218 family)